jgi:hypothetical protein
MNVLVPILFFGALIAFFGYKYYKKHHPTVAPPAATDATKK